MIHNGFLGCLLFLMVSCKSGSSSNLSVFTDSDVCNGKVVSNVNDERFELDHIQFTPVEDIVHITMTSGSDVEVYQLKNCYDTPLEVWGVYDSEGFENAIVTVRESETKVEYEILIRHDSDDVRSGYYFYKETL